MWHKVTHGVQNHQKLVKKQSSKGAVNLPGDTAALRLSDDTGEPAKAN